MVEPVYSGISEQDITDYLIDVRDIELAELEAVSDMGVEEAVRLSVLSSDAEISRAVRVEGELMCLFGVTPIDLETGMPWLLMTNAVGKYHKSFVKHIRIGIVPMLEKYNLLYNVVDIRNTDAIMWLQSLGFVMVRDIEIKIGFPVKLFEMRRA